MSVADDLDGSTAPTINSILASVESRVQGATRPLLVQEFRWAMQEFLHRTQVWRVVETIQMIPGVNRYRLPVTALWPAVLPDVLYAASVGETELTPALDVAYQQAKAPAEGLPRFIALDGSHALLYPVPQEAGTLVLHVSLTIDPAISTGAYPTPLLPYSDTILSGSLSRVYAMDNRPWTNLVLARYNLARFHNGMMSVRHAVSNSRSNRSARIVIPRFGA